MNCDRIVCLDDSISPGHNWPGRLCRSLMPGVGVWQKVAT